MKKRTWVWIMEPITYEISCDICGGIVEWSEWEKMVWCPKCKKDTKGTYSIFDGPIPVELCKEFGISFDRYYLKSKKVKKMKIIGNKLIWR